RRRHAQRAAGTLRREQPGAGANPVRSGRGRAGRVRPGGRSRCRSWRRTPHAEAVSMANTLPSHPDTLSTPGAGSTALIELSGITRSFGMGELAVEVLHGID